MPVTYVDLDLTFVEGISAGGDVTTELTFNTPENIGERYIPVVYEVGDLDDTSTTNPIELTIGTTVSGDSDFSVEFVHGATSTATTSYPVQLTANELFDDTDDVDVVYQVQTTMVSGYLSEHIDFIGGSLYAAFNQRAVDFRPTIEQLGVFESLVGYTNFTGLYSGPTPVPYYTVGRNLTTTTTFNDALDAGLEASIDLTFAGWVTHYTPLELYSTIQQQKNFDLETTVSAGRFTAINLDLQTVFDSTNNFEFDLYSSLIGTKNFSTAATVISGAVNNFGWNVYACTEIRGAVDLDIDLLSLYISNFSLDVDAFMYADQVLSVDVTDDTYNVVTSGTYFMVDGVQASVTYSGIDDGYRVFFDAADDYGSLNGPTTISVRAENDNGDAYTRDYYVTFGYIVEYINRQLNFGLDKKIGVRMSAEDNASCPSFSTDGYWFETTQAEARDLAVSIVAIPVDNDNLTASISPQSTAYLYGKVFRVVLTCKDFAGNEMEPFVFEYKIEDTPVET
ncbi:MAG: hypothetical protein DRP42_01520 [Tenericutes bacterium]|nr:MAG: hypothetical protein DRP42_01520 [Mycoplasmatota bacterium]